MDDAAVMRPRRRLGATAHRGCHAPRAAVHLRDPAAGWSSSAHRCQSSVRGVAERPRDRHHIQEKTQFTAPNQPFGLARPTTWLLDGRNLLDIALH